MDRWNIEGLVQEAIRAREGAYAPYSGFPVGAAVLTASGRVFSGCNIENAASGCTICAERVAVFKAVSEGHRELVMIAVVADTPQPVSPCGGCRQVLLEFNREMTVIMANTAGQHKVMTATDLLPEAFSRGDVIGTGDGHE